MTGLLQRLVARAQGTGSTLRPSAMPPLAAAPPAGEGFDPLPTGIETFPNDRTTEASPGLDSAKPAREESELLDAPSPQSTRPLSRVTEARLDRPAAPPSHTTDLGAQQPVFRNPQAPGQQSLFLPSLPMDDRQSGSAPVERATAQLARTAAAKERLSNLDDLLTQLAPLLPQQRQISAMTVPAAPAPLSDRQDANGTPSEPSREVHVSIGRIEVRALPATNPAPQMRSERPESLSLEAYLERRQGGGR